MASWSDDFNRASLGTDWTVHEGALSITSNQLVGSSGRNCGYYDTTAMDTGDQYAEASVVCPSGGEVGVLLRVPNTGAVTGYQCDLSDFNGLSEVRIVRSSGGSHSVLATTEFAFVPGNTYTLRAEVQGADIVVKLGGTTITSITDASPLSSSNRYVGAYLYDTSATLDTLSGGDLTSVVTPTPAAIAALVALPSPTITGASISVPIATVPLTLAAPAPSLGGSLRWPGSEDNYDLLVPVSEAPISPGTAKSATATTLQSTINSAVPGDVITVSDGVISTRITVSVSGTAARPIVIRCATRQGVTITAGGFTVTGDHIHLDGFRFQTAAPSCITITGTYGRYYDMVFSQCGGGSYGFLIEQWRPDNWDGAGIYGVPNPPLISRYNRFERLIFDQPRNTCYFQNHGLVGNVISHCTFNGPHAIPGDETMAIKIGYGRGTGDLTNTYIQFNTFHNWGNGTPYIVGVKSSNTRLLYNWNGGDGGRFEMRNGDGCYAVGNVMAGSNCFLLAGGNGTVVRENWVRSDDSGGFGPFTFYLEALDTSQGFTGEDFYNGSTARGSYYTRLRNAIVSNNTLIKTQAEPDASFVGRSITMWAFPQALYDDAHFPSGTTFSNNTARRYSQQTDPDGMIGVWNDTGVFPYRTNMLTFNTWTDNTVSALDSTDTTTVRVQVPFEPALCNLLTTGEAPPETVVGPATVGIIAAVPTPTMAIAGANPAPVTVATVVAIGTVTVSAVVPTVSPFAGWGPDVVWTDISQWLRSMSTRRGRSRETNSYETGTATLVLDNRDGRFSPGNLTGPYVSGGRTQILPRRPVRIAATWNGQKYPVFYGLISVWDEQWPGSNDAIAVCQLVDMFSILGGYDGYEQSEQGGGEFAGARLRRIAANAAWPDYLRLDLEQGANALQATNLSSNALTEAKLVADSDGGYLFAEADGSLRYMDRYSPITATRSNTVQASWGDSGGAELPYSELVTAYSGDNIYNIAALSKAGGVQVVADDAASRGLFGDRPYTRDDLICAADSAVHGLAELWVARFAQPEQRVEQIGVRAQKDPATLWPVVLGALLRDLWQIARTPASGVRSEWRVFLDGIEHDVTPSEWTTRFSLGSATMWAEFVGSRWDIGSWDSMVWSA